MRSFILAAMIVMSPVCKAEGFADKLVKFRPLVEKYAGMDMANKIWGVKDNVLLPAIPEITNETTSTDVYKRKKDSKMASISADKKEQYDLAFVNELIAQTREVKANRGEITKWMGTLSQGATREGIYRAMVLDAYYARLENYNSTLSKGAQAFAIKFMKKYIGKEVKPEKLANVNIYTIKRIVTERALDIIDIYLSQNEENLYSWYGVFSKEIATDYPIWENKLRANKSATLHKKWASKAPVQFVKSEVIIKLHKLFNNLQKRN